MARPRRVSLRTPDTTGFSEGVVAELERAAAMLAAVTERIAARVEVLTGSDR